MGKSSPQAPPAPDPVALTQGAAEANRINVTSPYGEAKFSGPGKSNLDITLSPEQQQILGKTQGIQGLMAGAGESLAGQLPTAALNFEGLPGQVSNIDTSGLGSYFGQDARSTQDFTDAVYEGTASRLRPEFETQNRRQEVALANKGIPIGSEAWQRAHDQTGRTQADALSRAALDATLAGSDLSYRARGQGLSELGMNANLQNQARSAGIGERQALRASPYNELAAILSGSAVQQPTVIPPGQVDTLGAASLGYAGQNNAYQAALQNRQANLGGLYSLGAAAVPFAFR